MTFIRVRNVEAIKYVEPHLIPDDGSPNNEIFKDQIRSALLQYPDFMYFMLVMSDTDTESPQVEAFLIAFAPPGWQHVHIAQAWGKPGTSKIMDQVFFKLMNWADLMGKSEVIFDTKRDALAMTRRWGFKTVSTRMSFELGEDWHSKIIDSLGHDRFLKATKKEDEHGQVEQAEHSEHVDGTAEATSGGSLSTDRSEHREDGNAVRRSVGSGSESGISEHAGPVDEELSTESEQPTDGTDAGSVE